MFSFLYKEYKVPFTFISLLSNFVFMLIISFLVYFYNKIDKQLKSVNSLFNSFQLNMEEKFNILNNEMLVLKSDNAVLMEKLNLVKVADIKKIPSADISTIIQNSSEEYKVFIIKLILVVIAVITVSSLIYFLSISIYA